MNQCWLDADPSSATLAHLKPGVLMELVDSYVNCELLTGLVCVKMGIF